MPRNLDTTLAAHLGDPLIAPAYFVEIDFKSGKEYVWTGVGDFVGPNGHTFKGVGDLGGIGPIGEGTDVKAEGTTITLSGIGDSAIPVVPNPGTPPFPPAPGESVAFSYGGVTGATFFQIPPSIWNAFTEVTGSSFGGPTTGSLVMTNGITPVGGPDSVSLSWLGFPLPAEIPIDATITHVYAMVNSTTDHGGFQEISVSRGGSSFTFSIPGLSVSGDLGGLDGVIITAQCANSVPGPGNATLNINDIALAVYYTGTPKTKMSLLQEALGDIWLGAPAKIWYGLLSVGAATLLGVPYLNFSGTVDKPSIHIGLDTLAITLALENRLVNLQRANQRRYTSADQKLYYPTDMAFNWVEPLNDIALRWGS